MIRLVASVSGLSLILLAAVGSCDDQVRPAGGSVVWNVDNLQQIGGHRVQILGQPRVVSQTGIKAVEFDGRDDALLLDVHPLAGARQFTVEVVFRPAAGGPAEQRFFHMQPEGSDERILFETRLTPDGQWFLDTFIKSGAEGYTLFADSFKHPLDRWYHAAIVVDEQEMRHYVDGRQELATTIVYQPQREGQTSLGVRINRVHWFQGAIRSLRFTRHALQPQQFLRPAD